MLTSRNMADTEHSCASGTEGLNMADIKMTGLKAVKVKVTLQQTIKAQRGSRDIAVLFL